MEEIAAVNPEQLIITDPPTNCSVADVYERYKKHLLTNNPLPRIVVVAHQDMALILDGNCRAYLLAHLDRPIRALSLTKNSDREILLALQAQHDIPRFPHQEYLAERMSLDGLRSQAIVFAKLYGFLTVHKLLQLNIDCIEPVVPIDSIESLAVPVVSKTAKIRAPKQEAFVPKTIECLVLYDRQGEHFIPILATRLKEARKSGYDCIKVIELPKIREGIAWAREHWGRLDAKVHELADIW